MDYLIKYVACYIFESWIQGFSFKLHNTKRVLFPQSFQMEISNYAEIRKSLKMHLKNVHQVKTKKKENPKNGGSVSVTLKSPPWCRAVACFLIFLIHETSRIPSASHLRSHILNLWWFFLLSFGQSLVYIYPSWSRISKVVL